MHGSFDCGSVNHNDTAYMNSPRKTGLGQVFCWQSFPQGSYEDTAWYFNVPLCTMRRGLLFPLSCPPETGAADIPETVRFDKVDRMKHIGLMKMNFKTWLVSRIQHETILLAGLFRNLGLHSNSSNEQ